MASDKKHTAWLTFINKVADVTAGYSKEDLRAFRRIALREAPSFEPVVEAYLNLSEKSDSGVQIGRKKQETPARRNGANMHLFDLLRDKRFFPQNLQLAQFAARVLPHMRNYRFDKMSRVDIAARIIEYIEKSDHRARAKLEESMREALGQIKRSGSPKQVDRSSFFSKWERIIKGLEL